MLRRTQATTNKQTLMHCSVSPRITLCAVYNPCCRREVLRPQPLFNFKSGGMLNVINGRELPPENKKTHPGFEVCMAVR
jgi:hypothetical protein